MSETEEVTPRRRRVSAAEAVAQEPELAGAAAATGETGGKKLTREQRLGKARQQLAAAHAGGMRSTIDPELAKTNQLRKAAGLKPLVPPVQAYSLMQMPDPTVIVDGDGKPVGNPEMPTTIVPRGDMAGGNQHDTRINTYQNFRMVPVRYREDDPDGKFKAGEIVESPFGVHMQHHSDEDEAAYWARNHPTSGVDAQADALAQLAKLDRPGHVVLETGGPGRTHDREQYQRGEAHYISP